MKVWVAMYQPWYESGYLVGLYRTREAAKAAVEKDFDSSFSPEWREDEGVWSFGHDHYVWEEEVA